MSNNTRIFNQVSRIGQTQRAPALIAARDFQLTTTQQVYSLLGTIGMGLGTYHGYRRNQSIGWAIGWGLLGAIAPVITIPVALAQGFGERKR